MDITTLLTPYMPIIAYALVVLFMCLYAVVSSIEFGAALFIFARDPAVDTKVITLYMSPVWEAVNVFLIFSLVGTVMFFPGAVPALAASLYMPISIALIFYVIRVLGIQGVLYAPDVRYASRLAFAVGSIGAPVVLSSIFYFFITGESVSFPPALLVFALWGTVVSAIVCMSSAFFMYFAHADARQERLPIVHRYGALAFACSSAWLLSLSARYFSYVGVGVVCILIAVAIITALYANETRRTILGMFASAFAIVFLVAGTATLHAPYIVFPSVTMQDAFTSPVTFMNVLYVLPFGLLAILPALFLLFKMYAVSPRK